MGWGADHQEHNEQGDSDMTRGQRDRKVRLIAASGRARKGVWFLVYEQGEDIEGA